jgi:ATP-dependent RNA helicase DeaD
VEGITHVINYELPDDIEVYTHRSGRTARAGKRGFCVSICHTKETFKIRQLERIANAKFHKMDIPTGKEVCRKQFFYFMDKLMETDTSHGAYEAYLSDLTEKFADISKEEVLQRIAAREFNQLLKYYENAEDLNTRSDFKDKRINNQSPGTFAGRGEGRSFSRNSDSGYTKLFVNLGTKDGFYKASFLQFILDESGLRKDILGKIDMREMHSWVEVDSSTAAKMIRSIDGKNYNGRLIRMNEADGKRSSKNMDEKKRRY